MKIPYILLIIFSFLLLYIFYPSSLVFADYTNWTLTAIPRKPHHRPTATLLNDGTVLVFGYLSVNQNVEIYNSNTNSWTIPGNSLIGYQNFHTATLLNNGDVLISGDGLNQDGSSALTAEVYSPSTFSWKKTNNLVRPHRINASSTLLQNRKVLIAGGGYDFFASSFTDTEVYDPLDNSWSSGPSMNNPRNFHTATLLANGNVLVAGGGSIGNIGYNPVNTSEIYDTQNNVWISAGNMLKAKSQHRATLLKNGKVLVTGGFEKLESNNYNPPLATVELYDPTTNQWSSASPMAEARALHTATLLPDGRVLVAGGMGDGGTTTNFLNSSEIYDPITDTWTPVASMNAARFYHGSTIMQDGKVFTVGGENGLGNTQPGNSLQSAEIFSINDNIPLPTPTPINTMTDFKQTDPQWSTAPNLPANVNTRLNHSLNCGDMYGFGCAVTSVADVFYSYGKTMLANTPLNPGSLNNWLTNNKGFQFCSIIWPNMSATIGLGAPNVIFRNNDANWTAGQQAIDSALAIGNLPIIGVYTNPEKTKTHFFVISEKLPDVNGKPNYKIVDPALYPFTANNPGKTGQSLNQAYGGWDKVFETVIYKKGTNPQKTLTVRAHSPVQMLITDPSGDQTGYDESQLNIIENIPNSSYGIEPGIAPVEGSSPEMEETKYFQQIDPAEGEYELQLIGTGNGNYSLDFSKTDEEGNVSTEVIEGFAQRGVTEVYQIEYTPDANTPVVVEKQVTFDILKSDLKALYMQGEVKNKTIYNLLKLQIEFAERMSLLNRQPFGNNFAIFTLKTIKIELNRQRGKYITEEAYQTLYIDINSLIEILEGDSEDPGDPGGSGGGS